MLKFIAQVKESLGYEADVQTWRRLRRQVYSDDPTVDIRENIRLLAEYIKSRCAELGIKYPTILMERGAA